MQKITLKIGGMQCSACSTSLQNTLSKLDGLQNVVVDIATEKASFELDDSKISIDQISKEIDNCGFSAL